MAERSQTLSLTLVSPEDVAGSGEETIFAGAPETNAWLSLEVEDELVDLTNNAPCLHGRLIMAVRVYRSDVDLEYSLSVAHGELSADPEVVEEEAVESFFINLDTSLDLSKEGASEVLSAVWEGEVRDESGNLVANPPTYGAEQAAKGERVPWSLPAAPQSGSMSFANGVLSWPMKLHGTLRVRYLSVYERWLVTIEPREDESMYKAESYYSHVSAFYAGRAEDADLTPDFDCSSDSDDDDDDEDEDEQCYWHVIEVDPCTMEPTGKEWDEIAPCPDDEETDEEGAA